MTTLQRKTAWVSGFIVLSIILVLFFLTIVGVVRTVGSEAHYHVVYNFAGGVEVGSPVRVSGVKVGKVTGFRFLSEQEREKFEDASVVVDISISKASAHFIRSDSKVYVNMAGIIGERYIEVSSGSQQSEILNPESWVRGIDPPRVDQLLSQGYGVFGKVIDFLEANESTIENFLKQLTRLLTDANQILKSQDKKRLLILLENMEGITTDMKKLLHRLTEKDADLFFSRLSRIVEKGDKIDREALKKFLQDEGIRTKLF